MGGIEYSQVLSFSTVLSIFTQVLHITCLQAVPAHLSINLSLFKNATGVFIQCCRATYTISVNNLNTSLLTGNNKFNERVLK